MDVLLRLSYIVEPNALQNHNSLYFATVPPAIGTKNFLEQLKKHFITVDIRGDGNCFFRAVSHCMYRTQDYHLQIRRRAAVAAIETGNLEDVLMNRAAVPVSIDDEFVERKASQSTGMALGYLFSSLEMPHYWCTPRVFAMDASVHFTALTEKVCIFVIKKSKHPDNDSEYVYSFKRYDYWSGADLPGTCVLNDRRTIFVFNIDMHHYEALVPRHEENLEPLRVWIESLYSS
jgi:hypothetical protein